jgi:hypothetical protein
MTGSGHARYRQFVMTAWQSDAAFVVLFRTSTDVGAGRLEGKVEHISSCKATRFHSLDELLAFIAGVLDEIGTASDGPRESRKGDRQ